jgi:hypothetical protein
MPSGGPNGKRCAADVIVDVVYVMRSFAVKFVHYPKLDHLDIL